MSEVAKNFNLIQIGSKWHYRRRVPKDLKSSFDGKTFIKYALKTGDLKQARELRDIEEVKWNEKFKALRSKKTLLPQLPIQALGDDDAKVLIGEYVSQELKRFLASIEKDPPEGPEEREGMEQDLSFFLQHLKGETPVAQEMLSRTWTKLEALAAAQKLELTSSTSVISHLLRALIEISSMKLRFLDHDFSRTHIDFAFQPGKTPGHRFGNLASAYLEKYRESAKLNGRTPKAVDKVAQNVSLMVDLVGPNTLVSSLNFEALDKVRFKLAKVPANYKKLFKGKPIDQAIELASTSNAKLLGHKTQRQYLGALQQMLKLALSKGWLASIPPLEFKPVIEQKIKDKDKKKAFTVAQLKKFFSSAFYKGAATGSAEFLARPDFEWRYWLPIIALYSGMRGNEIAQLLTSDIGCTEAGTHYFEVSDETVELDGTKLSKSLKTDNSKRKIPVHQALIDVGFLAFVERRRKESGVARLFQDLKPDKYGNLFAYASRRFNEAFLPTEMGLEERQSFHSFRHCFRNALRQTNASPDTLQALGAWEQGSLTSSNYGELSQPDHQKQFIDQVAYGDLDLNHCRIKS